MDDFKYKWRLFNARLRYGEYDLQIAITGTVGCSLLLAYLYGAW